MPLKHVRKNSTPVSTQNIVNNNMAILFGANNARPKKERQSVAQVRAAALSSAGIKPKKKK